MAIAQAPGEFDWEFFLEPLESLKVIGVPTTKVNINMQWQHEHRNSLVEDFKEELKLRHGVQTLEKNCEIIAAMENLQALTRTVVTFEVLEAKWKNYQKAIHIKVDCDKTASQWTIDLLKNVIGNRINVVKIPLLLPVIYSLQNMNKTIDEIHQTFQDGCLSTESDHRMIIDAILQPLCLQMGLKIKTEHTFTCRHTQGEGSEKVNILPTSRCDYVLYYKGHAIGVVEAKRFGTLNANSVAQVIVQLFLLQAQAMDEDLVFGILTDGYNFIMIGLLKHCVQFYSSHKSEQIEVSSWKTFDELNLNIIPRLEWIIKWALAIKDKDNLAHLICELKL